MKSWPTLPSWGVLVAATVLLCWPLLTRANLLWGMDMSFAAQMTEGMLRGIGDGHLYPRWVDPMSRGLGAPAFVFYPPLAYWVTAPLAALTGDLALAIRIAIVAGFFLSGVTFFVTARPLSSEWGAALGAALYVLLPYHAIDLYDRAAFAELTAFVWTPLVFLFVRRTAESGSSADATGLAISYAGLALTHLVTGFVALFAIVPYGLWLVWRSGDWRRLAWLAAGGAAGLLLAAVYLVPMLAERPHVHLEYMTESFFGNWRRNFAFRDETLFGFQADPIKPSINAAVGWQALLAAGACALLVARCAAGSRSRAEGLVLAGLSAWVVFLQLPVSTPVWATFPELAAVQFPWRFGAVQGLLASLLCAVALSEQPRARVPVLAGAATLALLAAPAVWTGLSLWDLRQYVFDGRIALEPRVQSKPLLEYTPRAATNWRELPNLPFEPPLRTGVLGPGEARVLDWSSHQRRVAFEGTGPARLWIATYYHPGWRATIGDQELPLAPAQGSAWLVAEVPAGEHQVVFRFGSTPARRIGAALSAVTALGLLALWLKRRRDAV
jgi:hypothetical protein